MDIKKLAALISDKRAYGKSYGNLAIAVESDRGRILNSAAVRRLQQKTQVFPLERNAAVRSRLTHSLEVQQNGRFIVQEIERSSSEADKDLFRAIESIVEIWLQSEYKTPGAIHPLSGLLAIFEVMTIVSIHRVIMMEPMDDETISLGIIAILGAWRGC